MDKIPEQHTIQTPYRVGPVHCYTLERDGDLILFDTGPPTREAKEYLRSHVDLKRLTAVVVTHCHIDHYGLAFWLEQETGATLYLPYRDSLKIKNHNFRMQQMHELLSGYGFSKKYLQQFRANVSNGQIFPPFPLRFKVAEQSVESDLQISFLDCAGHSQSDLVYLADDWAITGDTLLRGIFQSPLLDIDLEIGGRFSNYRAYCTSIKRLVTLRNKVILPGHRGFVAGVDDILVAYITKLLQRAKRLIALGRETKIPLIIEKLFGKTLIEPFHIYLKCSEILFMQDFLAHPELLADALKEIGLFEEVSELFDQVAGSLLRC